MFHESQFPIETFLNLLNGKEKVDTPGRNYRGGTKIQGKEKVAISP